MSENANVETKKKRSKFPGVFWVANAIEVLERFSYYGIYMGFGIYMTHLGFAKSDLGWVQSVFLFISYGIPIFSGTFADRYGFKKVLIASYLLYLPTILLLLVTKSLSGIALTMIGIAMAAGTFKPLIAGTVRVVTDGTNKTLGFGIFYQMVNFGASFGPIVAGNLRALSWNKAFLAMAGGIVLMLIITIFFYKEPPREMEGVTLKQKFKDLGIVLTDYKFVALLVILGIFFWLPFWAFFNILGMYVDQHLDTARLYFNIKRIVTLSGILPDSFGRWFTGFFSAEKDGQWRILGETIAHTGFIIMFCQVFVSRIAEKFKAIPTFIFGLVLAIIGFVLLAFAKISLPVLAILGVIIFAVGEMVSSPRIQEYITWIAPKEKAGLYMGANFLSVMIGGGLSGITYTAWYGYFENAGTPDYIWYALAGHTLLGIIAIAIFTKTLGAFEELDK